VSRFGPRSRCGPRSVSSLLITSSMALATVVAVPGLEATASAGTATTASVLTAAANAIAKETAVHLTVSSKSSSNSTQEHVTADLGEKSGVETISEGSAEVVFELTPGYVYVSGNSKGLSQIIGLSSAEVKMVGKDWVSVKAGSSQYAGVASGLKVSSVSGILPKTKGTKLSMEKTATATLYVLTWTTAATSSAPALSNTLTLSARGATLPVDDTSTDASGDKQTISLSKWDERVDVTAPPARSTIPYSKLS
jgi:hypothetical protein